MNLNVDVGQNLTSLLEKLAQQIGTTADKVFPWYVQQALNEGVTGLVALGIFTLLSAAMVTFSIRFATRNSGHEAILPLSALSTAVLITNLLFGAIQGVESARKVMNPNYYAVKMLARDIGNLAGR